MDPNKPLLPPSGLQPARQQSVVLNLDPLPPQGPSTGLFQFPVNVIRDTSDLFGGLDDGMTPDGQQVQYTLIEGPAGDGYLVPSTSGTPGGGVADLLTSLVDVDPTSSMPLVVSNQDLLDAIGR